MEEKNRLLEERRVADGGIEGEEEEEEEEGEGGGLMLPLSSDDLLRYVSRLRQQINLLKPKALGKDAEDEPSNPLPEDERKRMFEKSYRLERDNTVKHYGRVRECTVAVVGLGRIGSQVCKLLAKSDVGSLILIDKSKVEVRHLEASAYKPEQIGMNKTQACRLNVFASNPSCKVHGEAVDVTKPSGLHIFKHQLTHFGPGKESSKSKKQTDLVICCLDTDPGREKVNQVCLELGIPLLNVSLEPCASQASVNLVSPGKTACLACLKAKEEASQSVQEKTGKRRADDDAALNKCDLPGLAMMLAGLVAQNAVKTLLNFGTVLPSFKFRTGLDDVLASAKWKDHAYAASKEYQSFQIGPFERCPDLHCQRRRRRAHP